MNKINLLKDGLIASTAIISILSFCGNLTSFAATDCTEINEENVKYVNATFVDIEPDLYNSEIRGMTTFDYYPKPMPEREAIDKEGIYFGSTEGRTVGGIQNGFTGTNVPNDCKGVLQGLVENKLVNGNLKVVNKYKNGTSLFPDIDTGNGLSYQRVYKNYKMPFLKNENGYYSFNSDEYHLCRDDNSKKFTLHKGARGGFYPFNDCQTDTTIEENKNLFFTVKMEIPFYMTGDGKIKNQATGAYEDMVFNFSGDDDVWIFVDDTLAVDLGGTHIKQTGNINFAQNQVYYSCIYNEQLSRDEYDVTRTAFSGGKLSEGEHTLKIFYMERAGGISNLFVTFNLQNRYNLTADYLDQYDGTKVAESTSEKVIEGEQYTTEQKTVKDYTLVEVPQNASGIMPGKDVNVKYYYRYNKAKVKVNYIDETTGDVMDTETLTGTEGDKVITEDKAFDDYVLVEKPEETTFKKKDQELNYYYKKNGKIIVNYIDKANGALLDKVEFTGMEGTTTTSEKKSFPSYKFFSGPESNVHTFNRDVQEINYYYVHQSKIIVNYIDIETNDRLDRTEETVTEGTIYEIEEKAFDYYKLVAKPDSLNILIGKDDLEYNLYYQKLKFNLKVEMNLKQATINDLYHELKNKIGKVELNLNEANSNSSSKIHYIIKVTNDQEREGKARLIDYLPEGYMALQDDNPLWTISADKIYVDIDNINPGQTIEYELILTKKDGVDVCGTITNKVAVQSIDLEETTLSDNEDKNDVIIMPRTGAKKIAIGVACALITLLIVFIKIRRMMK